MTALVPPAPAPRFELPDLDGTAFRLESRLVAGPVWLVFLKADCPTCALGAPFLERAHVELGGAAGPVVVMEDDPEAAARFAAAHGWTLPVAVEPPPYAVSAAYGLVTVPTHFLVRPDGTIEQAGEGFVRAEWNAAAAALAARAGRPDYELIRETDGAPALRPG